ncbi:hypothetical protein [Corynebacterium glaucum]|nr:hypothetical protein [Corynebacterium glaucum]
MTPVAFATAPAAAQQLSNARFYSSAANIVRWRIATEGGKTYTM